MSTSTWQRRRAPEDVPAPVAVAVADYCRRAKAPASPLSVREALSLLDEADDFRIRALTDEEPELALGPFAVVDVVSGTDPKLAARREETGYYEVVKTLADERAGKAPPFPAPPVHREAPAAPGGEAKRKRAKPERPTIEQKIAPKKRSAGLAEALPAAEPLPAASSYLPRHQLPTPRGRFSRVEPTKASFETLLRATERDELAAVITHVNNRVALRQTLEHSYAGSRAGGLTVSDVEAALERHGLLKAMAARERGAVLAAFADARGAQGRTAHSLGMNPQELDHLIGELKLGREIGELRDRFVREALSSKNLQQRIDLLGRTRYLEDLGIERKFREALSNDLEALLDESADATDSDAELVALVAKKESLNAELLLRAVEKLGLTSKDEE